MDKPSLLNDLESERKHLQLGQVGFGDYLGIDRTSWWRVRQGQLRLSSRHIALILRAFPHLKGAVADYVAESGQRQLEKVRTS